MKTSRDFICLSYKYTDYLIEKKLIAGSLYLEQKNQNLSSLNSELFDKNISVINLDTLISQSFFDAGVSKEKMLIRLNDFFLETTAQAFVKTIPLDQFKMFGTLMDAFFQKKGEKEKNFTR